MISYSFHLIDFRILHISIEHTKFVNFIFLNLFLIKFKIKPILMSYPQVIFSNDPFMIIKFLFLSMFIIFQSKERYLVIILILKFRHTTIGEYSSQPLYFQYIFIIL